tara:strand:+ start:2047 stop:2295 length:249 start_codon:yes stop_codon:yes gene_type:complete
MNEFKTILTEYLSPSRTLETVVVSNKNSQNVFSIYNYKGNSFRVFKNQMNLMYFFQDKAESYFHFCTETELDSFLSKVELVE